jgi:hypothetical protein
VTVVEAFSAEMVVAEEMADKAAFAPVLLSPLFTRLPRREILGSPYPASCIEPPLGTLRTVLRASTLRGRFPIHLVVLDKDAPG